MLRNQIHPITLFSLLVMALAALCLGIAGEFFHQQVRYSYDGYDSYDNWNAAELVAFCVFLGVGFFLLVGAIGLILHKNWARIFLQVCFGAAGLFWLFFVVVEFSNFRDAPFVFGGITAAILGLVVGAILFLTNESIVMPYFRSSVSTIPLKGQVLDDDLDV